MPSQQTDNTKLPVYWINREQDKVRREKMETWLDKAEMSHTRIEATVPDTIPNVKILKHQQGIPTPQEIACLTSHLKAITAAYKDGSEQALIMEDDAKPQYLFNFQKIISTAPKDWEVLQLHVCNAKSIEFLGGVFTKLGALWQEWESIYHSSSAYIVNRKGMEKIISLYLPQKDAAKEVDVRRIYAIRRVTSEYIAFKRTNSYSFTVPLFTHDLTLGSTIHPEVMPDHALALESIHKATTAIREAVRSSGQNYEYPFAIGDMEA